MGICCSDFRSDSGMHYPAVSPERLDTSQVPLTASERSSKFAHEFMKEQENRPEYNPIIGYCKNLVNVQFHGSDECDRYAEYRSSDMGSGRQKLADALKSMDEYLREIVNGAEYLSAGEDRFQLRLSMLLDARSQYCQHCVDHDACAKLHNEYSARFHSDAKRFVRVYRGSREGKNLDDKHWASRQQLLAGKVIADKVDLDYGPLDPVFGVLLSPSSGLLTHVKDDSDSDSEYEYDESSVIAQHLFNETSCEAYHVAVGDAYSYHFEVHNKFGYYYWDCKGWGLDPSSPLFGTRSGLTFWSEIFQGMGEADIPVTVV